MENQSAHFIFDGEKIVVSPDLHPIIIFLQEIESEIKTFINFDKQLESIRKQYLETVNFIEFLASKLKENDIDFKYNLSEHPKTIAEKLKIELPVRSEMIVLFSYLEVLICLNSAYENKTSNEDEIRKLSMNQDNTRNFIKNFCLSTDNEWSINNTERLKHITEKDFRSLRNSLTHFFSAGKGLGVSYTNLDEKSRRLEKATNYAAKFMSPKDLYEITKGATILMMKKWSADCIKSQVEPSNYFKDKILCVKEVVNKYGAVIVKNNQIDI